MKNATESSPHNSRVSSPWKMPWGSRTQEEKKTLAGRWLELAAAFAGVPIQYEAEQIKQRETQPTLNMELGVTL